MMKKTIMIHDCGDVDDDEAGHEDTQINDDDEEDDEEDEDDVYDDNREEIRRNNNDNRKKTMMVMVVRGLRFQKEDMCLCLEPQDTYVYVYIYICVFFFLLITWQVICTSLHVVRVGHIYIYTRIYIVRMFGAFYQMTQQITKRAMAIPDLFPFHPETSVKNHSASLFFPPQTIGKKASPF